MNSQPFHGQRYACNKFIHKPNECIGKGMKNNYMRNNDAMTSHYIYGYLYRCNKFGHRATACRSNVRRSSYALQHSMTYYNCNKLGHIARFCRGKTVRSNAPQKKIDLDQEKKQMKEMWKKSEKDNEVEKGSKIFPSEKESSSNYRKAQSHGELFTTYVSSPFF